MVEFFGLVMKKRKMVHEPSRQLKISRFFCASTGSIPSEEKLPRVPLSENTLINDCLSDASENLADSTYVGSNTGNTFLHQSAKAGNDLENENLKTNPVNSSRGLGVRKAIQDCPSESVHLSSESHSEDLPGSYRTLKVSNENDSTIRTNSDSVISEIAFNNNPIRDLGSSTSLVQSSRDSVHGQKFSNLSVSLDSLKSQALNSLSGGGDQCSSGGKETEPKLSGANCMAIASEFLKPDVKGSSFAEEYLDISLEDWDLGACEQDVDDNVYSLQLNVAQRCRVVSIRCGVQDSKILVVASTRSKDLAKVLVHGIWASSCRVSVGDIISIQCNGRDERQGWWVLDDGSSSQMCLVSDGGAGSIVSKLGFIAEKPDRLVSGTSVVGSLFCLRKGVLSDRFRGLEMAVVPQALATAGHASAATTTTPHDDGSPLEQASSSARAMLIGSLVHQVLQECLSQRLHKLADVMRTCEAVAGGQTAAWGAYAAGIDSASVHRDVAEFAPHISRFASRFVEGEAVAWGDENSSAVQWDGEIAEVRDIEENLWVPALGLKGKVDVTVRGRRRQATTTRREALKTMPLELKTGRGSYSAEHQGQVLLYCAMMSAVGNPKEEPIDSGLLLYLRDESMKEIFVSRHAVRDLILLRNDLVHYLTRGPRCSGADANELQSGGSDDPLALPELPEPIRHRRACSSCPFLTVCTAHLKCDGGLEALPADHPMESLASQALKHLSSAHLDFFTRWSCLVGLEHEDCAQDCRDSYLWTLEPMERERMGRCVCGLCIESVCTPQGGSGALPDGLVHRFVRGRDAGGQQRALPTPTFSIGERVLVSCGDRVAVASGTIASFTEDEVCVCIDRDLKKRYGDVGFSIDKYEYASSASSYSLTSLGMLLSDTWSADRLRKLIIDRKSPTFLRKLKGGVVSKCSEVLKGLNRSQARAVLSAMATQDFLLIRGLPGTGKSATIVAIARAFVATGRSVLITGHTHSSVDNVLCRLADCGLGSSLLRLGPVHAVHVRLHPYCEQSVMAGCRTARDIERAFLSKAVVGATCMGCGVHPLISRRAFDVCILDEAGQVLLPISLRPILASRVFILVGDTEQLPPVVRSHRARRLGMEQTLFGLLDSPEACVALDLQYRMNKAITKLANSLSYDSRLICANEEVANSALHCPRQAELLAAYKEDSWLSKVLSAEMDLSVVVVDTGDTLGLSKEDYYPGQSCLGGEETLHRYANICEASVILYIVQALLTVGVAAVDIGVIAPYTDQVCLLRRVLGAVGGQNSGSSVDVSTVDQFQGRDKEIIIYSFTRSGDVSASDTSKAKVVSERPRSVAVRGGGRGNRGLAHARGGFIERRRGQWQWSRCCPDHRDAPAAPAAPGAHQRAAAVRLHGALQQAGAVRSRRPVTRAPGGAGPRLPLEVVPAAPRRGRAAARRLLARRAAPLLALPAPPDAPRAFRTTAVAAAPDAAAGAEAGPRWPRPGAVQRRGPSEGPPALVPAPALPGDPGARRGASVLPGQRQHVASLPHPASDRSVHGQRLQGLRPDEERVPGRVGGERVRGGGEDARVRSVGPVPLLQGHPAHPVTRGRHPRRVQPTERRTHRVRVARQISAEPRQVLAGLRVREADLVEEDEPGLVGALPRPHARGALRPTGDARGGRAAGGAGLPGHQGLPRGPGLRPRPTGGHLQAPAPGPALRPLHASHEGHAAQGRGGGHGGPQRTAPRHHPQQGPVKAHTLRSPENATDLEAKLRTVVVRAPTLTHFKLYILRRPCGSH